MVKQFTAHFQSIEIPVKLEHLKLCRREKDEQFSEYVKRFRNLASRMKETPDNKEIVKICGMNAGPAAWFLSSSPSNTFEELFDKVTTYEELQRVAVGNKVNKASVNVVTDYIPREGKKKFNDDKSRDGCKENNKPHQQWHDLDNYTFDLDDSEIWFDLLLKNNEITPSAFKAGG